MADEPEFKFKSDADMNAISNTIKESFVAQLGSKIESIKCKGVRIYYVDETTDVLVSSGLFVKGFDPEEWDD